MNYLLLTAIITICVIAYFVYKKYAYNNFDQHAEIIVRVLLDHNNGDMSSQYGCIIFQLPSYGEHVKEVVLTDVHSSNKHIRVNAFEKLNFFITPGKGMESAMRSIGFAISNKALDNYSAKNDSLLLKGYIVDIKGQRKIFVKNVYFALENFTPNSKNSSINETGGLAV